MDRKRMMDLVDQHMTLQHQGKSDPERTNRTGKQTLKLLLSDDGTPEPEPKQVIKPKIILYLRDGLNPADSNFTKNPNEMYNLTAERLTPYETVLYMWLWRISWGYGRNFCRFSRKAAMQRTSLNSESTVRRAITGLREKHFMILALDKEESPVVDKEGSLFRICTPSEILAGRVEEGIPLDEIPMEGVFCKTRVSQSRVENDNKNTDLGAGSPQNRVGENPVPPGPGLREPRSRFLQSRVSEDHQSADTTVERLHSDGVLTEPGQAGPPLKDNKDSLKDTLSPRAIVSGFYKGIGQPRISKEKRERAENDFRELLDDGFDPEDIQFAVEWTLKNAKEELYDFSIIKHTIGQAMAAKKKAEEGEAKKREKERIAAQEEAEEKRKAEEERQIKAYKESLDADERVRLRQRAEAEIKNSGQYKTEFITDYLIEAMENNLIRNQIDMRPSE